MCLKEAAAAENEAYQDENDDDDDDPVQHGVLLSVLTMQETRQVKRGKRPTSPAGCLGVSGAPAAWLVMPNGFNPRRGMW